MDLLTFDFLKTASHNLNPQLDCPIALLIFEFYRVGSPEPNAPNQLRSTVYFRVVAQASEAVILQRLLGGFVEFGMQHFSGM